MLSFEQCCILFSSFPLLLTFDVGGLGFEFCVFIAGWRHALRRIWPFIIDNNKFYKGPGGYQVVKVVGTYWCHSHLEMEIKMKYVFF